jgi:single-strand DNA-binding protein
MSINKVILVGNVGKDPVVRYFDKGVAKATFPLATSETYTNQQGETITSTEWHNIVLWRALAEVAEKTIKKGAQVYIVGKIKTRSYVDKDGVNKYITEILADTLLVLEKKPAQRSESNTGQAVNEPPVSYQSSHESYNKAVSEDPGVGNPPENAQNEDDLPF